MKKIIAVFAFLILSACSTIQEMDVRSISQAEISTYEAIAPDYSGMFEGSIDPSSLTFFQIQTREDAIRAWELRVLSTSDSTDDQYYNDIAPDYELIFRGNLNPLNLTEEERQQRRNRVANWAEYINQISNLQ